MPGAAGGFQHATQRGGALGKVKPEQQKRPETSGCCVHPYSYPTKYQGRPKQPPWQQ